jgi:hypothetical protein
MSEELQDYSINFQNSKTELDSKIKDHKLLREQGLQDKRSLKLAREQIQSLETQLEQCKEKVTRLNAIAVKHGGKAEVTESAMHHTQNVT